jgi:hypothetical protein
VSTQQPHNLLDEWLDRLWTLTWGGIVLATGLLLGNKIESGLWWSVFQLLAGIFGSVQVIQTIGEAANRARSIRSDS